MVDLYSWIHSLEVTYFFNVLGIMEAIMVHHQDESFTSIETYNMVKQTIYAILKPNYLGFLGVYLVFWYLQYDHCGDG